MNAEGVKKLPISRKSVFVSQSLHNNASAFKSIPVSGGLEDPSGSNLYAGGGYGFPTATAITPHATSCMEEPIGEFNVDDSALERMDVAVGASKPSVSNGSFRQVPPLPPPVPKTVVYGNDTSGVAGRNTPAMSTITQFSNAAYVELMRLQRSLAEGDAVFDEITNKRNTFNKAIWLHVWPYTKLILVPDFSFKHPDFVGEMFDRATVTNNCAIQMCEGCLEYLGKPIALDTKSVTDMVTFWQTHCRLVKKTFVDIRNSVVDGMKVMFVKDYLGQDSEFVEYIKSMGTECPDYDDKRTEFQQFLIYTQYKWNNREALTKYRKDFSDDKLGMIAKRAFVYFLECFGSKTVRKRVFFEQVKRMKLSEILSISDEAFACVVVELGFQLWSRAGRKEIVISRESRHRPSFRESYEPRTTTISSTKSIYDTLTCATYYNRAYEEVENSRILDSSVKFEDDYFYKKSSEAKSRKRQRQVLEGRVETGYYIAVQGMKKKRHYV